MKKLSRILTGLFVIAAAAGLSAQFQQITVFNATISNSMNAGAIISNDSCLLLGSWNRGIFRSLDSATTWTAASTGLPGIPAVRAFCQSGTYPKKVIAATDSAGLLYTNNRAGNWQYLDSGITNNHVYAVIVGGASTLAATLGGGVFLSADDGAHWAASNTGLSNLNVRSLVSVGANMYAGADGGNVFRSADRGVNWTPSPLGSTTSDVYAVTLQGRYAFAATYGAGLFRSADSGRSWAAVNSGITQLNVRTLLVNGRNLYAGADSAGVFLSSDSGETWTSIGAGLPAKNVAVLYVYGANLLAGTSGSGLWKRALSEFISVEQPAAGQLREFSLDRNYPNPFSPATAISYRVSKDCPVSISVYGLDGKLIKSLVNGQKSPGYYKTAWNSTDDQGRQMNPGVYVVKMNAGKFSASRKIIYLK